MSDITVVKRDGSLEDFDSDKISNSIMAAAMMVGGEDMDLADELADTVLDILEANEIHEIESADLQKIVEKTLIETGHAATSKEYILKGADRNRMREMDSALMKSFEEITFQSQEESETKRENANIDSSTAMGTMLKYGSEGAKKFNLLYLMSKDIANAHINCDIHIHDLDFLSLTETCIDKDALLVVKINNNVMTLTAEQLANYCKLDKVDSWKNVENIKILSNGKFVNIKSMIKHNSDDKHMLNVVTPTGELHVTDEHTICVVENGIIVDKKVKDVKVGDILSVPSINIEQFSLDTLDIIENYNGDNLVISNTDDIIKNIKDNNNWKAFCNIFDYRDTRALLLRSNHAKMTISEYKSIEHLCTLNHSDLKLNYTRSQGNETINAVIPLTFELGNIIGLMYTEGSITEHIDPRQESPVKKACFCNYDEALIQQFNKNYLTVFNNAKISDRKHKGRHTGSVLSGYLQYELFHGIFGCKYSTDNIRLAQWMFSANKNFISGLLAGIIDGDGTVQKDGYRVSIASVSKEFLKDIQKLLLLRGIKSTIKKSDANAGTVTHFVNDGVEVKSIRQYDNYKLEITGDLYNKIGWINSNKINSVDLSDSDKFPYKYVTITDIYEVEYSGFVYDLETDDHHFTADGFNVHNCCQIPIDRLFKHGFNTGHGFLREPGGIRTASALSAIAIQSNQNDQHGGQSIPLFDYYLAPYVSLTFLKEIAHTWKIFENIRSHCEKCTDENNKKFKLYKQLNNKLVKYWEKHFRFVSDNDWQEHHSLMDDKHLEEIKGMLREFFDTNNIKISTHRIKVLMDQAYEETYEQTFQSMEAFIHNLNTMHSRAGAQVPFSSINYGTDTSVEGRMIVETILKTTWDGLGNGETPIFPIQIFKLKAGVSYNPGDPNYDLFQLSCKVSAKRLYPNFVNLDASYNAAMYIEGKPETEMATMGCRTRVGINVFDPDKSVVPGRGNLSFTSINLPRLGIRAQGNIDKFFKLLDEKLELVHRQLLERFNIQCQKHPINYPFLMGQGCWLGSKYLGPNDDIKEILKHGTLTVGFIGLAETLVALIGKHHGESEEAQKLGLSIIQHMRDYTDAWSKEEHMNYSVIGTPAEGLSGRFVRADKELFGTIPGVTDRAYYTNSSHVPVYYPITAYKKIEIESPYHSIENGGHILYIEMDGDPTKNLKAFEKIVRYMHDNDAGYMSINHPVDRDPICGYVGIIDDVCPRCGRKEGEPMTMEMWYKINGYAGAANADTLGYHGDTNEEADRLPNLLYTHDMEFKRGV